MANFNNFNPYTYNYNNQYQNNVGYNNPYINQYQNQQQAQQLHNYAFVNGIEGAKAYQIQPNQMMLLMDSDNLVVYMKQANSLGQSQLRYFKLIETNEQELRNASNIQETNKYVSNEEFNALKKEIEELKKMINKEEESVSV